MVKDEDKIVKVDQSKRHTVVKLWSTTIRHYGRKEDLSRDMYRRLVYGGPNSRLLVAVETIRPREEKRSRRKKENCRVLGLCSDVWTLKSPVVCVGFLFKNVHHGYDERAGYPWA